MVPDPQSPVTQEPNPDPSKLHPVRPQNLPDQPVGARNEREVSFGSSKPVLSSLALPAFARIPGHTVYSHLFTKVNVAPKTPETTITQTSQYSDNVRETQMNKREKTPYTSGKGHEWDVQDENGRAARETTHDGLAS